MSNFDYSDIAKIAFSIFNEAASNAEDERKKNIKRVAKNSTNADEVKDYANETKTVEDAVDAVENTPIEEPKQKNKKSSQSNNDKWGTKSSTEAGQILAMEQIQVFKDLFEAKTTTKKDGKIVASNELRKSIIKGQDLINELIQLVERYRYLLYKVDAGDSPHGIFEAKTVQEQNIQDKNYTAAKEKGIIKSELAKGKATVRYTHNKKVAPDKISFTPSFTARETYAKSYIITLSNVLFAIKLEKFNKQAYLIKMLPNEQFDFMLIMPAKSRNGNQLERGDADESIFYKAFDFLVQTF